jgi:hypothetical protein
VRFTEAEPQGATGRRALLAALAGTLLGACSAPLPDWPSAPSTAGAGLAPASAGAGLAPAVAARSWPEFQRRAARRMVDASPGVSYLGPVPEPLLAIPVLEIELDRAGGVLRIEVRRMPTQARDTVQLAIDAVRRAAPYGDMSRLPRPWKFTEIFLFDDQRRFKPRTLDE